MTSHRKLINFEILNYLYVLGSIPSSITNLSNLSTLKLSENSLTGIYFVITTINI